MVRRKKCTYGTSVGVFIFFLYLSAPMPPLGAFLHDINQTERWQPLAPQEKEKVVLPWPTHEQLLSQLPQLTSIPYQPMEQEGKIRAIQIGPNFVMLRVYDSVATRMVCLTISLLDYRVLGDGQFLWMTFAQLISQYRQNARYEKDHGSEVVAPPILQGGGLMREELVREWYETSVRRKDTVKNWTFESPLLQMLKSDGQRRVLMIVSDDIPSAQLQPWTTARHGYRPNACLDRGLKGKNFSLDSPILPHILVVKLQNSYKRRYCLVGTGLQYGNREPQFWGQGDPGHWGFVRGAQMPMISGRLVQDKSSGAEYVPDPGVQSDMKLTTQIPPDWLLSLNGYLKVTEWSSADLPDWDAPLSGRYVVSPQQQEIDFWWEDELEEENKQLILPRFFRTTKHVYAIYPLKVIGSSKDSPTEQDQRDVLVSSAAYEQCLLRYQVRRALGSAKDIFGRLNLQHVTSMDGMNDEKVADAGDFQRPGLSEARITNNRFVVTAIAERYPRQDGWRLCVKHLRDCKADRKVIQEFVAQVMVELYALAEETQALLPACWPEAPTTDNVWVNTTTGQIQFRFLNFNIWPATMSREIYRRNVHVRFESFLLDLLYKQWNTANHRPDEPSDDAMTSYATLLKQCHFGKSHSPTDLLGPRLGSGNFGDVYEWKEDPQWLVKMPVPSSTKAIAAFTLEARWNHIAGRTLVSLSPMRYLAPVVDSVLWITQENKSYPALKLRRLNDPSPLGANPRHWSMLSEMYMWCRFMQISRNDPNVENVLIEDQLPIFIDFGWMTLVPFPRALTYDDYSHVALANLAMDIWGRKGLSSLYA